MAIVGFNFTKILVERKRFVPGNLSINNNVTIDNIEKTPFELDAKKSVLKFLFKFVSKYDPDIGFINIEGECLYLTDKDNSEKITESWKKDKRIPKEIMVPVLSHILNKANVEAIILSKEMNLPSPIPMPKIDEKARESAVGKPEEKEVKKDKKK